MSDAHGVARDQLRAFIERIERLEEEKKTIADDIKDVYGEAKAMGFIPAMIKKVVALRKKDEQQRMEEEAILDNYLAALGMLSQHDLFEEPHHPKTGEIIDPKLAQTIVTGMQTETGRKALIAAVDIMIAREEAEQDPVANVEEEATGAIAAASNDPASRADEDSERQHSSTVGFADDCRTGGKEQSAAAAAPVGDAAADAHGIPESHSEKNTASHGEAGHHSAERVSPQVETATTGSAVANVGGDHVDDQRSAATAGAGISAPVKPLRPLCRNPGEHCGGYGSTHCGSCLKAAKAHEEVFA